MKVKIPRGEIEYVRFGKAGGPKVLALHGWLDNHSSFEPLGPLLPNFDLIIVDLPGHGDSFHRPPGTSYHFIDWITDVDQILDALGWEKANLMGHSLGGGIAAVYAGTFPNRVERLVLIESLAPISDSSEAAPAQLNRAIAEGKRLAARKPLLYKGIEEVVKLRMKATPVTESSARNIIKKSMEQTPEGWRWKSDPRCRLASPLRLSPEQVLAFVKNISCPTLAIMGNQGMNFDVPEMEARKKAWQNLAIRTVEGQHHVHMDHPERVAPLIEAFLSGK